MIYLIRHAQASFGADDYDALSPLGLEQARVLGEALATRLHGAGDLQVWCGAMKRHRQTAEGCLAALAREHALEVHAGFNEFDHEQVIAVFEPRYATRGTMQAELRSAADPARAFQAMFLQAMARWTGGAHDADYVESWPAFRARCVAALQQVAAALPREATALVFTSGGTLAALCQELLGLDIEAALRLNWRFANAGITKLATGRDGPRLLTLNEHGHFEGANAPLLTFR
jgi:broad specificity phosphatase PhoE